MGKAWEVRKVKVRRIWDHAKLVGSRVGTQGKGGVYKGHTLATLRPVYMPCILTLLSCALRIYSSYIIYMYAHFYRLLYTFFLMFGAPFNFQYAFTLFLMGMYTYKLCACV